jgi:hypothetical protein
MVPLRRTLKREGVPGRADRGTWLCLEHDTEFPRYVGTQPEEERSLANLGCHHNQRKKRVAAGVQSFALP